MNEDIVPSWAKEIPNIKPLKAAPPSAEGGFTPDWASGISNTKPLVGFGGATEEEKPTGLTRSEVLNNPERMSAIKDTMMLYQGGKNIAGKAVRVGKSLLGATDLQLMGDETDEEVYDKWLEHSRLLTAGQSTTLVNEVALVSRLDDSARQTLKKGYDLFDSLQNVYTGDSTLGEKWEATKDYTSAVVWDPTTFVSFGVGKAYTAAGTKAAAVALRASVSAGKSLAVKAVAKQGLKGVAAETAVKTILDQAFDNGIRTIGKAAAKKEFGIQLATDFALEVGKDTLRQTKLDMVLDEEREYKYSQTAIAALGAIVLPSVIYGAKGVAKVASKASGKIAEKYGTKDLFAEYANASFKSARMSPQQLKAELLGKLNKPKLASSIGDSFDNFLKDRESLVSWKEAKVKAEEAIRASGNVPTNTFELFSFYNRVFFGGINSSGKELGEGLVHALKRDGIAIKLLDEDDKVANFLGDAISYVDNKTMKKVLTDYQKVTGTDLGFNLKSKTLTEDVGNFWKTNSSMAGMTNQLNSLGSRILGREMTLQDLVDLATANKAGVSSKDPAYGAWLLSVRNRALTAHPSTTAINARGWAYMSGANSISDLVEGSLNYGAGKLLNKPALALKGKGTFLGVGRKAYNILNWDATVQEGVGLLEAIPRAKEDLFKILAGDAGMRDPREFYNLGDKNAAVNATEGYIKLVQTVWGVNLLDAETKLISFVSNFDQALMKNFDTNLKDFMGNPKWQVELRTTKFLDTYEEALDKTLRETGAKSWTDKSGNGPALAAAKFIEKVSNSSSTGWVLPFGRWFNTSTAFISDYSGASLLYNAAMRGTNIKKAGEVDIVSDMAKAASFWGGVALFQEKAEEKLASGTPWNFEVHEDGTREDITNQFPRNVFAFASQAVAHARRDGYENIPKELNQDGAETLLLSAFKGTENTIEDLKLILGSLYEGDIGPALVDIVSKVVSSNVSAITRGVDPVNTGVLLFSEDLGNPDRRQGAKSLNEAFRYLDGIVKLPAVPERQDPTKGTSGVRDIGKVFSGFSTKNPVAVADRMIAAVGQQNWRNIRWVGDPMVKNRMDEIFSTVVNTVARDRLESFPDFFDKPIEKQQIVVKNMLDEAKSVTRKLFESGIESKDRGLFLLSKLNSFSDKRALDRAQKILGVTDLAELLAEDGGVDMLETLLYTAKIESEDSGF